jgi:hypothetical protein
VCSDLLVAVGALFLWTRGMVGVFRLHRVLGRAPRRQPTSKRPCLASLLSEKLRHTGAGTLLGSGAVGDDFAIGREALEVSGDLRDRPGRL